MENVENALEGVTRRNLIRTRYEEESEGERRGRVLND